MSDDEDAAPEASGPQGGGLMSPKRLDELEPRQRWRAMLASVRWIVTIWVVLFGTYYLAPNRLPTTGTGVVAILGGTVLFATALTWQTRRILRSDTPQLRAIEALGALVALFLVLFAISYAAISASDPASFTQELDRSDAMYFTITVFATVGFGDITAVSTYARTLVSAQMILDLVVIAALARFVFFAARVTLHRPDDEESAASGPPGR